MATSSVPVLPQVPKNWKTQILNADGLTAKNVATGDADGSKIVSVVASSNATADIQVQLGIMVGTTFYVLSTVNVTTNAGHTALGPTANLLDPNVIRGVPLDNDGQQYVFLTTSTDALQAKALTTVNSTGSINIVAFGADF